MCIYVLAKRNQHINNYNLPHIPFDCDIETTAMTDTTPEIKMSPAQEFEQLLRSTGREGIETVILRLHESGFFEAPASTVFHGNYHGGLVDHSLNVCHTALKLRETMTALKPSIELALPREHVIISALLHDVCKADIYKEEQKWRKNKDNNWESYLSYGVNYSSFPVGHGEKSVIRLLQWGLRMEEDEILAIRWHMTAWDMPFQSSELKSNLSVAQEKYPLLAIIQAADTLATSLLDQKKQTT